MHTASHHKGVARGVQEAVALIAWSAGGLQSDTGRQVEPRRSARPWWGGPDGGLLARGCVLSLLAAERPQWCPKVFISQCEVVTSYAHAPRHSKR